VLDVELQRDAKEDWRLAGGEAGRCQDRGDEEHPQNGAGFWTSKKSA